MKLLLSDVMTNAEMLENNAQELEDVKGLPNDNDVADLPTAQAYAERQRMLKELILLYAQLVKKDKTDIINAVKNIENTDSAVSKSYSGN